MNASQVRLLSRRLPPAQNNLEWVVQERLSGTPRFPSRGVGCSALDWSLPAHGPSTEAASTAQLLNDICSTELKVTSGISFLLWCEAHLVHETRPKEKLSWWSQRVICPSMEGQKPVLISASLPVLGEQSCPDTCLLASSPHYSPSSGAVLKSGRVHPGRWRRKRSDLLVLSTNPVILTPDFQFPRDSPSHSGLCVRVNIRPGRADVGGAVPVKPTCHALMAYFSYQIFRVSSLRFISLFMP